MEEGAAYDDGYDYGGYEEEEGYEGGLIGPGGEQNKGKTFLYFLLLSALPVSCATPLCCCCKASLV